MCAKAHARLASPLKKESNKSFQTALERRGDATGSKQPPEVTPLWLQRQLHKLHAGVGTDGNAARQKEKALASRFLAADYREVLLQYMLM